MNDPALPPGFEEDPPPPPGFEMDEPGPPATAPFSSVPTLDPATGRASTPSVPGNNTAKPTLTQQITALVETGLHLASAATGGVLGAIGGAAGAFAGSASQGGLRRQPDGRVPALDAIGEGAKEGAQSLTYVPRSGLGLERSEQAAKGLSQLAPLGGLPAEAAALSTGARMVGRDLRTAGSAALDANREFNTARTLATEAKTAKQVALDAPERAGIEAANAAGYKLTPKAAKAGVGARMTQTAAGSGRLEKEFSLHNAENTGRLAREDVGLPDDVPATPEATAAIRKQEGENYAAVKDVGRFKNDVQYGKDLDNIVGPYTEAAKDFPELLNNPIIKRVEGLRKAEVDSASAIEVVKDLRNEADKAFRAGDKKLGTSYRAAASAVDNSLDRALTRMADTKRSPELAEAVGKYRAARVRIAKTYLLDEAMDGKPGEVNAMAYKRALEKGAKLDGAAKQIAEFAKQFGEEGLTQKKGKSGGVGPDFRDMTLAALHAPTALAALVARPAARAALGSKFVQNKMAGKKPAAQMPEPPLTAEQSPFPAREDGAPPAGPLGDLTPDWETEAGAAAPAGRREVVPTEGLVPAVDEAPGPSRVLPGGADLRARSNESPAGPVEPGPVAEPPAPSRRAGEQIPAVPGRPDLPDVLAAEGPAGITPSAPGDPRAPDASYANRVQQGLEKPGGYADEPIPVGEATELAPTDPRLAELDRLQQGAKSEAVKKALSAEAAKVKREIKAQAEAEKLKADVAELRQAASGVKDAKLKERLLARAAELEKPEKLPVGEVTEGQPEIKPEKTGKIPVGKATEVPNEPATGRAPEIEKLPTGEATHVTDSGVEEAIPVGETKELFVPPEKAGTAEVTLKASKSGKFQGTDAKGDPYDISVTDRKMGAENPERSLLVEAHDPVSGQRRGFAEFVFGKDGKLSEQNVKIAPYLKKRNIEEILRRAVKEKGHQLETKPGDGNGIAETKKPEAVPGQETSKEKAPLPEGVTIRELKSGEGFEALNAQGNRIGYLKDNLKAGQAEQLKENANVSMVKVDKAFSGKGVGRALYQAFDQKHGGRIMPSGKTEPSAWKVWKRNYPQKVDAFVEQEVARVRGGAEAPLVVRNITDPEVRARVAAGIDKLKKPKP